MIEEVEMVAEVADSRTEIRVLVDQVKHQFDSNAVREASGHYHSRMKTQMAVQLDKVADGDYQEGNAAHVELLARMIRLSAQESVRNVDEAVRELNALISKL